MKGHVYILVNSALPNLVKIGRTTKEPKERAAELSSTGTPGKFIVAYSVLVDDCVTLEKQIHEHFSANRHSSDREFFEVEAKKCIDTLIELSEFFKIDKRYREDTKASENDSPTEPNNLKESNEEIDLDLSVQPSDIDEIYYVKFYLAKLDNYTFRFGASYSRNNDNEDSEICERIKQYLKELGVKEYHSPSIIRSNDFQIYGDCKEFINSVIKTNIKYLFSENFSYQGFNKKYYKLIYDQFTIWNFRFHTADYSHFIHQFKRCINEIKMFESKRKLLHDKIQCLHKIENKKIEEENEHLRMFTLINKFNV